MKGSRKLRILFLCTKNSCRSQMAEGWTRHLKGGSIEPFSAGIEKHRLDPYAVRVMAERGVDISAQHSKHVDELEHVVFDWVVTVCDNAKERCPVFPSATNVRHVGFRDPQAQDRKGLSEGEILDLYRKARDEIESFITTLPESLLKPAESGDRDG